MTKNNTQETATVPSPLLRQERGSDRFNTELPVEMDGIEGLTRNISATGIYFETDASHEPGKRVRFVVEMMVQGRKKKLVCDGEVVRVDHKGNTVGIAARLVESFFSDVEEVNISPN